MIEKRKSIRYESIAKVKIMGFSFYKEECFLKDISMTGCRLECPVNTKINANNKYKVKVLPESDADVGSFTLAVESMWMRSKGTSFEVGFSIIKSPKGKQFAHYVDYLSWRHSQEVSMTGNGK